MRSKSFDKIDQAQVSKKKKKKLKNELQEAFFHENRHNKQHLRNKYVTRFRKEFPQFKELTHQ